MVALARDGNTGASRSSAATAESRRIKERLTGVCSHMVGT